jgi:hypothetical protein
MARTDRFSFAAITSGRVFAFAILRKRSSRMVKKLRLLKGGSVPTFVGLGPVLHNKLAVDA